MTSYSRALCVFPLLFFAQLAFPKPFALPYCTAPLRLETKVDDADFLAARLLETKADAEQANRVNLYACWDRELIHFLFEVQDRELMIAPNDIKTDRFHAYDSLQVYLDPLGDSTHTMNRDDIDILMLPDGRSAVLRGDELWRDIDSARVPQRESAPLLLTFETTPKTNGWRGVLRIPFAGLGISATPQRRLRFDLAMNDWLVNSDSLNDTNTANTNTPDDAYFLPLTLSGVRDFGFPKDWLALELTGHPPLLERLISRFGVRVLLLGGLLISVGMMAFAIGFVHRRHQRQMRELLSRLSGLQFGGLQLGGLQINGVQQQDIGINAAIATTPTLDQATEAQEKQVSIPIQENPAEAEVSAEVTISDNGLNAPDQPSDRNTPFEHFDPRDHEFAKRVLNHVRDSLAVSHSPASLAAHFHVSVRTLQRRLKAGLGTNPQDLVLAARLEHAHELLQRGTLRVNEVASLVGFDDLSHFSRRFRDAYGKPPSQARPQSLN